MSSEKPLGGVFAIGLIIGAGIGFLAAKAVSVHYQIRAIENDCADWVRPDSTQSKSVFLWRDENGK